MTKTKYPICKRCHLYIKHEKVLDKINGGYYHFKCFDYLKNNKAVIDSNENFELQPSDFSDSGKLICHKCKDEITGQRLIHDGKSYHIGCANTNVKYKKGFVEISDKIQLPNNFKIVDGDFDEEKVKKIEPKEPTILSAKLYKF